MSVGRGSEQDIGSVVGSPRGEWVGGLKGGWVGGVFRANTISSNDIFIQNIFIQF